MEVGACPQATDHLQLPGEQATVSAGDSRVSQSLMVLPSAITTAGCQGVIQESHTSGVR